MGNWTKGVTLDPIEFDGDTIVFTANRILSADMASLMTHYDATKQMLVFAGGNAELADIAADLFPKYITAISGMTKGDSSPFTVDEFVAVAHDFYFAPLVGMLFSALMVASSVGKDAKNSMPPAPNLPVASDAPETATQAA